MRDTWSGSVSGMLPSTIATAASARARGARGRGEDRRGEAERSRPLGGGAEPVDGDREGEARQQRDEHAREAVVLPRQARREGARPQERVTDRAPEPLPLGLVRLFHPSSA